MEQREVKKITVKKKYKNLILIIAGLLLITAAAGYAVFIVPNRNQEEWVYKELTAEKGELAAGVTESGTLSYQTTSQIYDLELMDSQVEEGEEETVKYLQVESVQAAVGQRITEGDLILSFTQESIEGVRKLLKAQESEAQVALAEAKSEYNLEVLDVEQTYQERVIKAQAAQIQFYNTIAEPVLKIQEYEVQITLLYEQLGTLSNQWEKLKDTTSAACLEYNELHEQLKVAVDHTEYSKLHGKYLSAKENYENLVKQKENVKEQISAVYEQMEAYERKIADVYAKQEMTGLEGQQTYDSAVVNGELAADIRENEIQKLMLNVEKAEEDLLENRQKINEFENFVQDGNIYAKESGVITEVAYEEGDYLRNTGTIFSYTTAEDMQISVDVSQEDIVNLEVGDKVDVVFSAYEKKTYEGIIASIMTAATSEYAAAISYEVTISILGDTSGLFGGMTADVTFVIEKKEDVVYVSKTAVFEENGKHYVYVKNDAGEMVTREVITGMENTIYIEITEGLSEGDILYAASKVSSKQEERTEQEETSVEGTEKQISEEMKTPDSGGGQMPDFGGGQMPDSGGGQMPDFGGGQMPDFGGGQMPDFGGGQIPEMGGRP